MDKKNDSESHNITKKQSKWKNLPYWKIYDKNGTKEKEVIQELKKKDGQSLKENGIVHVNRQILYSK